MGKRLASRNGQFLTILMMNKSVRELLWLYALINNKAQINKKAHSVLLLIEQQSNLQGKCRMCHFILRRLRIINPPVKK